MIKSFVKMKYFILVVIIPLIVLVNGCSEKQEKTDRSQYIFEGQGTIWKAQYLPDIQSKDKFVIKYELINQNYKIYNINRITFSYGTSEASQTVTYDLDGKAESVYFVHFEYQKDMLDKMQDEFINVLVEWEGNKDSYRLFMKSKG